MSRITQEQIEQARQIDILAYMQTHEPDELVRVGSKEYKTRTHDSLRISENGKWNWCSQGFGGTNALNYLIRVKGIDFVSAVRLLCESSPVPTGQSENHAIRSRDRPSPVPFSVPTPDQSNKTVLQYLRGRGISDHVLTFCINQKLLYQTNRKGYKNCVFIGRDGHGNAKYACVRGCGGDFRGDVAGSQKRFGFCIPASNPDATKVEVYEAPIDALSGATLRMQRKREWRSVHYLALGGLNYHALDQFLSDHPKVRTLQLCLDADEPGCTFAGKVMQKYSEQGYSVQNLVPPKGKDVNEYLQIRLGLKKEQER